MRALIAEESPDGGSERVDQAVVTRGATLVTLGSARKAGQTRRLSLLLLVLARVAVHTWGPSTTGYMYLYERHKKQYRLNSCILHMCVHTYMFMLRTFGIEVL